MNAKCKAKKRDGFTLVEALIVGMIAAVLAISAVVMYRGFITETRHQTVENLAEAAAAAANAYVRKTGEELTSSDVEKLHLYYDSTKYEIEICGPARRIDVTDLRDRTIIARANY